MDKAQAPYLRMAIRRNARVLWGLLIRHCPVCGLEIPYHTAFCLPEGRRMLKLKMRKP